LAYASARPPHVVQPAGGALEDVARATVLKIPDAARAKVATLTIDIVGKLDR